MKTATIIDLNKLKGFKMTQEEAYNMALARRNARDNLNQAELAELVTGMYNRPDLNQASNLQAFLARADQGFGAPNNREVLEALRNDQVSGNIPQQYAGISPKQLDEYYRTQLALAQEQARQAVMQDAYDKISANNGTQGAFSKANRTKEQQIDPALITAALGVK